MKIEIFRCIQLHTHTHIRVEHKPDDCVTHECTSLFQYSKIAKIANKHENQTNLEFP